MTVMQAEEVKPYVDRQVPVAPVEGNGRGGPVRLARVLGWFSLGLGLVELVGTRRLGRLIGVDGSRGGTLKAFGVREILTGLGILRQARARNRLLIATAAVLGVAALGVLSGRQLSRRRGVLPWGVPKKRVIEVTKTITVNRQPHEVYAFWHDFENFPRFMTHLESVEITGQGRSHWKAKAPAGRTVEWDAIIVDDQPNQRIAWETVAGSGIDHAGSVRFEPAPGDRGTEVWVQLRYAPLAGRLGSSVAKLFGEEPKQQIQADLRAFKSVMETGEIARASASDAPRALR